MERLMTPEDPPSPGRIVAIEPDPRRARALKALLRGERRLSIDVVATIAEAVEAIERRVPDVVMASAFLPPADGAELIDHLKQIPDARHVPVIDIPHGVDGVTEPAAVPTSRLFGLFRRTPRVAPGRGCDAPALRAQIEEYIREARATRPPVGTGDLPALSLVRVGRDETAAGASSTSIILRQGTDLVRPAGRGPIDRPERERTSGADRRRARRRRREEMPWLWTVKLPWGSQVRLVDMSSTGALIETAAKLHAGSAVDLKMIGEQANLLVPARTVRSEVAAHDVMGVVYRVAVEFEMELEMFGAHPLSPVAALRPRTLAEILSRVMAELDHGPSAGEVRTKFEQELRRVVPARDIRLRSLPSFASQGGESVYFTVPRASGAGMVLQVTFDRGYEPSSVEFRFLQAAASAAAVVAEFAPIIEEGASSPVRALLA